jgi:hypothetical protein
MMAGAALERRLTREGGRGVRDATRGFAIAFIIALMPAGIWSGPSTPSPPTGPAMLAQAIQTQAPPKPPNGWVLIEEDVWLTLADEPQEHFQSARESFLKKDFQRAAEEIRKAAAFVKVEAGRAKDDGKQSLLTSVRDLDKLADEVERGTTSSVKQLDDAFGRADHALAAHHHRMAKEFETQKAAQKAGYELKAAALYVEQGLAWAGEKADASGAAAIQGAQTLAGKLIAEGGTVLDRFGQGYEAIGKAIQQLGQKIAPAK